MGFSPQNAYVALTSTIATAAVPSEKQVKALLLVMFVGLPSLYV